MLAEVHHCWSQHCNDVLPAGMAIRSEGPADWQLNMQQAASRQAGTCSRVLQRQAMLQMLTSQGWQDARGSSNTWLLLQQVGVNEQV